jgi:hypothetical protein
MMFFGLAALFVVLIVVINKYYTSRKLLKED